MTEKQLKQARLIESDIYQTERDIEDITKILDDYSNFGSTITFKRNSDSYSRSFGSKKNDFRINLSLLLTNLKRDLQSKLKELKEEFKDI